MPSFPRAVQFSHQLIEPRLGEGDIAVDATVGNGHDTVFLANRVGKAGHVFGFDIQPEAIEAATKKVEGAGLENITFYTESHAMVESLISTPVKAAMFNLGYFPGGDKSLITHAESTITALDSLCRMGTEIITIAVYYGHKGGEAEAATVSQWAEQLEQSAFTAIRYEFVNQRNSPPFLIAVERRNRKT